MTPVAAMSNKIDSELHNRALIALAYLRTQGWNMSQIAEAAEYSHATSVARAARLGFRQTHAERIIAAANDLEASLTAKKETPVTPIRRQEAPETPSQSANTGVLDAIRDARNDLKRAHGRLMAAADRAVPLLRPGLLQMAQRMETLCRDLEVS